MDSAERSAALPLSLPPSARIYLSPRAPCGRADVEVLIEGSAMLSLADGALAFGICEVTVRLPDRIHRVTAALPDIRAWANRLGGPLRDRVGLLLDNLSGLRRDGRGKPLLRPRLMGIINVTPDSFSDGGEYLDPAAALARARKMAEAGADILDVGGESTRPGAAPVAPEVETARVLPVLQGLAALRTEFPQLQISIDTRHAAVMRAALAAGVDIINDVTALSGDPRSMAVAAASNAAIVLMHMRGDPATMNEAPAYDDVALDVFDELEARVEACVSAGIGRERLIVDPGIGFAKRRRHNLAILRALPLFHGLGCPLLLGVSRKGLLPEAEGQSPRDRLPTSLAAAMHALNQGVQLLRVHDVAETRQLVNLWERIHALDNGH
jgi:dihydropteroate synthase